MRSALAAPLVGPWVQPQIPMIATASKTSALFDRDIVWTPCCQGPTECSFVTVYFGRRLDRTLPGRRPSNVSRQAAEAQRRKSPDRRSVTTLRLGGFMRDYSPF